jgi:hypothetical protein
MGGLVHGKKPGLTRKIIKINLDPDFIAINTILKSDQNHIFPPFSSKFNYFLLYVYVNINNPTLKSGI